MAAVAATPAFAQRPRTARVRETWRALRRSRSALLGLSILALHLLIALSAPWWVPHSPTALDPAARFASPSREHLFGTDQFGRDNFTRVMLGGRVALVIALTATTLAVALGGLLGIFLGYAGGLVDEIVMRFIDALLAIPGLLFLLMIVTGLGSGNEVIILAMALLYAPGVVRVTRGAALEYVPREFVAAARARGERGGSIVVRELWPNLLDVLLVEFAMRSSWMVLAISALSFLGFGVNPPTPDWGLMIAENRNQIALAWWGTLFPVLAIGTLVVGLNLAADGLAKALGIDRTRGAPV